MKKLNKTELTYTVDGFQYFADGIAISKNEYDRLEMRNLLVEILERLDRLENGTEFEVRKYIYDQNEKTK